jgi:tight adherence protein C
METLINLAAYLRLDPQLLFIVLSAAAAVCLGFAVVTVVLNARNPVRRRLASTVGGVDEANHALSGPAQDYSRWIDPIAEYVLPQDGEEQSRIGEQLVHAGFRSPKALRYFYGIKAVLAILLPLLVFVGTAWLPKWSMTAVFMAMAFAAFLGVSAPNGVVERIKENRLKKLRNGFPDALDLLVVCVEAGLGLGAAIDRVATDLDVSHPELAEELRLVNVEMRAGVERPQALKNLAARSGLDDIRGLVGLLVQTMRFGTSVADALRVYSEEFRDKRMQKAEEQAAKIGTKMIFPLVLCLFPAFFIVAVGPAVLRIIAAFKTL